jgi:hypothetical protein
METKDEKQSGRFKEISLKRLGKRGENNTRQPIPAKHNR